MTIDEIVIDLILGTEKLDKGLKSAEKNVAKFSKDVTKTVDNNVASSVTAAMARLTDDKFNSIFGKLGVTDLFFKDRKAAREFSWNMAESLKSITYMGPPAEKASASIKTLGDMFSVAREKANGLFLIMRGMFASTMFLGGLAWIGKFISSFKDMKKEVNDLHELSKQLNADAEEISAWSNAIEFNGGSAKSFQGTLKHLKNDMLNLAVMGRSRSKPIYEQLGIDTSNLEGKDIFNLLREITKAVEGMDKVKSRDLLQRLGFDADTIEVIQKGSKSVEELIKQQKEWGVYTKRDTEAVDRMDKALKKMSLALKSTFIPLFSRIIGVASKFAVYFAKASMWLRNNLDVVRKAVLLLAVAFSSKLIKALQTLGALAVKNPFVLFVLALGALLLLLEDLWVYANKGKSAFAGWWEKLGSPDKVLEGFRKAGEYISKFGEFLDSGLGKFLMLFAFLAKLAAAVIAVFAGIVTIPAWIGVAVAAVIAFLIVYRNKIKETFSYVVNKISETITTIVKNVKGLVEPIIGVLGTIGSFLLSVYLGIVSFIANGVSTVATAIKDAGTWVKEGFFSLVDKATEIWKSFVDTISSGWNKIKSFFGDFTLPNFDFKFPDINLPDLSKFKFPELNLPEIPDIFETFRNSDIVASIVDSWGGATNYIGDRINALKNDFTAFEGYVSDGWSLIGESAFGVVSAIKDAFVETYAVISDIIAMLYDSVSSLCDTIAEAFNSAFSVVTNLWEELVSAFDSGASSIGAFLSNAADVARRAWEGFITWLEQKWQWLKDLLPNFSSIASKLPSMGNSMQMAMAGGGGSVSNSTTTDNSVNNYTFNATTTQAADRFIEKSGFSSQTNTGVRR